MVVDICESMTMVQTMKIESALIAARLLYLLFRLKVISEGFYHKSIDYLTVKSLQSQIKEKENDKLSVDK
jgi:hypothetical protein